MMKLLIWLLLLLLLFLLDLPKMRRKKDSYDMWVFAILLLLGAAYGILFELDINLPNLDGLEQMIFEPIGKKLLVPIGQ